MIKSRILPITAIFALAFILSFNLASAYDYYVQTDVPVAYEKPVSYSAFSQPQVSSFSRPQAYAYGTYSRPRFSSSYNSNTHYTESPGYMRGPKATLAQKANSESSASNFDSSSYKYDYRGPLYEKKVTYLDDFSHDVSSKSGFFRSRSSDSLRHTIASTLTEKYVGATESLYVDSQNRRSASNKASQNTDYNYDGGFSFGKQRVFDSSEYGKDSYTQPYYYRPSYDSQQGYYNWRY